MSLFSELKRRNVIRVAFAYLAASWLLIQVVETLLPVYGFSDAAIRIVVGVLAAGFVPATIFAWVFELTPEGLKKESDIDRSGSITRDTGKKLDRAIIVVLAIALTYFAFDKLVLSESRVESAREEGRVEGMVSSYGDLSVAVLPFVDMSSAGDQEYMSDGIAEELLNLLAKIPDLRVISRSSAFSFKGKDISIPDIAEQLDVAHILEGSVRKSGNRIRITAQLIEAKSDTHLWSETYDRDLKDIFAIQDEVSAQVVRELKITLLGEAPKSRVTDPEAYELFLQARFLADQVTLSAFQQAIALYERVLEIDPDYVPAIVWLASTHGDMCVIGAPECASHSRLQNDYIKQALDVDPDSAIAHAIASRVAAIEGDIEGSALHMSRAIEIAPTDLEVVRQGTFALRKLGRNEENLALLKYVYSRDPFNALVRSNLSIALLASGDYAKVIELSRLSLAVNSDDVFAALYLGAAYVLKGDVNAALQFAETMQIEFHRKTVEAIAYHVLGDILTYESTISSLQQLKEEFEVGGNYIDRYLLCLVYTIVGDDDSAFTELFEYVGNGYPLSFNDPYFSSLFNDPRWDELMEKNGTPRARIEAIEFEFTIPEM